MKLDRTVHGRNKYALVKRRELALAENTHSPQGLAEIEHAISVLEAAHLIDYGETPETEFFVIRLKDRAASVALQGYALSAATFDQEYAAEVNQLADRAGPFHPFCQTPD